MIVGVQRGLGGTSMKSWAALVVSTCLAFATTETTAQMASSPEPSNGIIWDEPGATPATPRKIVDLHRVVSRLPQGETIGQIFEDMTCSFSGHPITVNWSGDLNVGDFRPQFASELGAAGYRSPNSAGSSGSLFDNVETAQPDLLIAAAITGLSLKFCLQPALFSASASAVSGTARIIVEWQVLDRLERKIVFQGTTQGQASVKEDYRSATMVGQRAAFMQAARTLFAMPEFNRVTAAQTAPTTNEIAPSASTTIPTVPLSTTPFTQNVKNIEARVVTVDLGVGHGSGFYIADGLLLTNHHVASKGMVVKLRHPGGREAIGNVIASHARRDVALISTAPAGIEGLPLRLPDPDIGAQVYVIGSPLDIKLDNTLSAGIVSAIREKDGQRFIQSDANIRGGNSGGPMFDDKGNVIGITTSARIDNYGANAGINFFIPIAEALTSVGVTQQPVVASNATKKTKNK